MLDPQTPLISEFLKDHQQFSRLLFEIRKLLAAGEIEKARERAIELDILAGAHIAYEEAELYPRLVKLGDKSASQQELVGQHHSILEATRTLIEQAEIDQESLSELEAAFQSGLSHAEHCGSLISLMSRLDEQVQADSLLELRRFRKEGRRWTELEAKQETPDELEIDRQR